VGWSSISPPIRGQFALREGGGRGRGGGGGANSKIYSNNYFKSLN